MCSQGPGKAFAVASTQRQGYSSRLDTVLEINTITASYKVAFKEGFVEKNMHILLLN